MRRYLDLITGSLVVHQLQPWHEHVSKQQVRPPKVYIDDPGLLHALLGINSRENLDSHLRVGASWEDFVLRKIVARLGTTFRECFFWATHSGAELDLFVLRGGQRQGSRSSARPLPT